jgi:hypothetical protein
LKYILHLTSMSCDHRNLVATAAVQSSDEP